MKPLAAISVVAWRLFTKGITKDAALRNTTVRGDRRLGLTVLDTISSIA